MEALLNVVHETSPSAIEKSNDPPLPQYLRRQHEKNNERKIEYSATLSV